jgi:uncharacterized protein
MRFLSVFICGLLFGCGLTISNMVNANKILNFLDITGNWDPSLAFVMLSAVIVTWLGYRFIIRQSQPTFDDKFYLPEKKSIDKKLVLGSAIFGIGWGIAGYCPGPAITALGLEINDAIYFIIGMVASLFVYPSIAFIYKIYCGLRLPK